MRFVDPLDLAALAFFVMAWIAYAVVLEWSPWGAKGLNGRMDGYREA